MVNFKLEYVDAITFEVTEAASLPLATLAQ